MQKFRKLGTTDQQPGSGKLHLTCIDENFKKVKELVLSQEDKSKTHQLTQQISRRTSIHRSSVHRIIHCDLQLKCFKLHHAQLLSEANSIAHLTRCSQLLKKCGDSAVDFMDEKVFTVEPPFNSQNDYLYALVRVKKRSIKPSHLFSQSVMMSVGMLQMGSTN